MSGRLGLPVRAVWPAALSSSADDVELEGKESAELSKMLATIRRDVPLSVSIEALAGKPDPLAFCTLCRELDLSTMPKKFGLDTAEPMAERAIETLPEPTFLTAEALDRLDTPVLFLDGGTLWIGSGTRILTGNADPDTLAALSYRTVPS